MVEVKETLIQALVISAATFLCTKSGKCTTLEVKTLIRDNYPKLFITQQDVSDIMAGYADQKSFGDVRLFGYSDNGTYRVYYLHSDADSILKSYAPVSTTSTSRSAIASVCIQSPSVSEITWEKKDGTVRTLQNVNTKGLDPLGYISVVTSSGEMKRVDPRKLISAVINNKKYVVNNDI